MLCAPTLHRDKSIVSAVHGVRGAAVVAIAFALTFLTVFLVPPFTPWQFPVYTDMRWGDVLDTLTPIVMLPMYWLVLSYGSRRLTRWEVVAFLVLGAAWIEGQAMHLAANSIGHLLEGGPAADLASFYDEKLSHLIWHGSALALSALVVFRGGDRTPASGPATTVALGAVAAAVYGFAFFLIAVEGATSVLAVCGGAIVTVIAARHGLRAMLRQPIQALFGLGYPVMLLLLGTWFLYWGGTLPEFSHLGLIK